MSELLISIVVPAYNEERYLGRCLTALARQTYPADRFEVIVVDNGSTDGTAEIARRYRVRLIAEPRKGVAHARQAGFATARGAVIASTDADTVVPPFWVARISEHFRADSALGAVYGPVHWPDGQQMERLLVRYPVTWGLWASNRVRRSLWWGSNFAVRREVFWEAGGFPVRWGAGSGEDTELARQVRRIAPVRFDPSLVVCASSRRAREGLTGAGKRMAASVVNRVVLQRPPLPFPDIR